MKKAIKKVSITLTSIAVASQMVPSAAFAVPSRALQGDVTISQVFRDQKLQSWLQNSGNLGGIGADGVLTEAERLGVTELNLSGLGLTSLEGLEAFPNLQVLNVSNNTLTELDLSGNPALTRLSCSYNRLTSLDLSGLSNLMALNCEMNYLTRLTLTGCRELLSMYCRNNLLTSLNLADSSKLEFIEASDNRLTAIDVSHLQALRFLHISGNQLTQLDMRHNTSLEGGGFMAQHNLLEKVMLPAQSGLTISLDNFAQQSPIEGHDQVEWFLNDSYTQSAPDQLSAEGQTLYSRRTPNRYTIYFSANGGNGSMAGTSAQWGSEVKLPKNALTRPGYTFTKWSTLPNQDSTTYNDEATVQNLAGKNTDGDRITLYARWQANNYTIRLDPNGGEGLAQELESVYGESTTLPENRFTNSHKEFAGWALSTEGAVWYPDQAQVQNLTTDADGEVTLYAVWRTPISELQKPYLAQLDEQFRSYGSASGKSAAYTAQDWTALAQAYAAAAAAIEAADDEGVMGQAMEEGIANMDAVPTMAERVQEIVSAWQSEHSAALDLLSRKQLTESNAQEAVSLAQGALEDLAQERLEEHSTVSDPADLKAVVAQAAEELQTTAGQLMTMEQAAQWLISLDGLTLRAMTLVQEGDVSAYQTALSRYQSLGEEVKGYISSSVSQALTQRQELAGQKRSDVLSLQEAYEALDMDAYSAKGQAALAVALQEGLSAVRGAASVEQSQQARSSALDMMDRVPTAEEEESITPPGGGDNDGSGEGGGDNDGSGQGSGGGSGGGSTAPEEPEKPAEDVTVTVTDDKTGASAQVTTTTDGKVSAVVTIPQGVDAATIPIPCKGTPGTVAMLVLSDGTRQVIPHSVYRDGTLYVRLEDSARVELVDAAKDFSDVSSGSWFSDSVQFASSRELFSGVGGGAFAPGNTMTRSMLVTVLHRLEGCPASDSSGTFQDVSQDTWYSEAVNWAADQGITGGIGESQFGPNQAITREAMALMFYRYAGSPELPETRKASMDRFEDAGQISPWASDAMAWAYATGLFTGDSEGKLRPQDSSTRAEVATVLMRFVEHMTL